MTKLPPLPAQPAGMPWPTTDWPEAKPDASTAAKLSPLLDLAFSDPAPATLGETHAFLAVQGGRIVAERYWTGFGPDSTHHSWSQAKSMTQALIGILVREGKIDIHAPADVPEWKGEDDPRRAITLDQLLRMSSGLKFAEDYVDAGVSDVIEMLFGSGKEDVGGFAAKFPLAHPPGTAWSYASGTTNIVARLAARALGAGGEAFRDFMARDLFGPLGMRSADPRFDRAGTFIGSSFCFCTERDFARFGLLYLRDGNWDGRRILPEATSTAFSSNGQVLTACRVSGLSGLCSNRMKCPPGLSTRRISSSSRPWIASSMWWKTQAVKTRSKLSASAGMVRPS